jgi:hypothetical protein
MPLGTTFLPNGTDPSLYIGYKLRKEPSSDVTDVKQADQISPSPASSRIPRRNRCSIGPSGTELRHNDERRRPPRARQVNSGAKHFACHGNTVFDRLVAAIGKHPACEFPCAARRGPRRSLRGGGGPLAGRGMARSGRLDSNARTRGRPVRDGWPSQSERSYATGNSPSREPLILKDLAMVSRLLDQLREITSLLGGRALCDRHLFS